MIAVVKINPFTKDQLVLINHDETTKTFHKVDINSLNTFLLNNYNLTQIHLYGPKDYVKQLIQPNMFKKCEIYINE